MTVQNYGEEPRPLTKEEKQLAFKKLFWNTVIAFAVAIIAGIIMILGVGWSRLIIMPLVSIAGAIIMLFFYLNLKKITGK